MSDNLKILNHFSNDKEHLRIFVKCLQIDLLAETERY
jgi:hypothetical protein